MREEICSHRVPQTDIIITIEFQAADPKLAAMLKDAPGKGRWIDRWYITRHPGSAVFVNYLHTGRTSLEEAKTEANFLWTDSVTRRDKHFGKGE